MVETNVERRKATQKNKNVFVKTRPIVLMNKLKMTLYDLVSVVSEEVGQEDDSLVESIVRSIIESGRVKFENKNNWIIA